MDYSTELKKIREEANFTQQEIADLVGIDRGHISHIERGRRTPSLELLEKWLDVCGHEIKLHPKNAPTISASLRLRHLVSGAERLEQDDLHRLEAVTHALETVSGLARDLLLSQLDGIAAATQKPLDPTQKPERLLRRA